MSLLRMFHGSIRFLLPCLLALGLMLPTSALAAPPKHLDDKEEEHINVGLGEAPKKLDRSTPLKAWTAFIKACQNKRWEQGAHILNLGDTRSQEQKTVGSLATRQLCEVLEVTDQVTAEGFDDSQVGPIVEEKPTNYIVTATIKRNSGKTDGAWLRRTLDKKSGNHVWVLTRFSVGKIQVWYQELVKKDKSVEATVKMVNVGLGKVPARYDLKTPRGAARAFIKLVRDGNWDEAARLIDLSAIPKDKQKKKGARLARRLSMILKRIHPGGFGTLSNDASGSIEMGVPYNEEVVGRTKLGKREVQVRLARFRRDDGKKLWLFSSGTVANIDPLYKSMGYGWAGDFLPPMFFEIQLWKIQLWQWLGLIVALILGYIFGVIASFALRKVLLRVAKMTDWDWDDDVVATMRGPLIGACWALGFVVLASILALAPEPMTFLRGMTKLVAILSLGWFLMRLMDVAAIQLMAMFKEHNDDMGMAMVPVGRKILKPILFVIILIMALQNIGMNVAGLVAGLGIGGLAFALAAKDTLANLFGSVAIAFDRPFKVGDFVQVGSISGSVEDIGLRSTQIRTMARTVVSIPNSDMADSKIENFALRDRRRLEAKLGLQYDTTFDQIRFIIDKIKRLLLSETDVWQDSFSVRFVGFGDSSLDIEIVCYLSLDDLAAYTATREDILMSVGDIVAGAGAEFAYPSQTVYVGKDSSADSKKAKQAAATVARLRAAGELCVPEIPETVREEVKEQVLDAKKPNMADHDDDD